MTLLIVAAIIGAMVAISYTIHHICRVVHLRNSLVALAVKEFYEATDSMMKTPNDLPEGVLNMIEFMSQTAFSNSTPRTIARIMRQRRLSKATPDVRHYEFTAQVEDMRPELRTLFMKMTTSWLNIVHNRNPIAGERIMNELRKRRVDRGRLDLSEEKEVIAPIETWMQSSDRCAA